ncbi:hypothetical protein D7X48_03135 [bacterium D16-50]|nr:hypothetical protein D7X48_03135 [bacterium D16-50]
MTEKNLQKKPYPLGVHKEEGGVRFSFVSRAASCGILLYDRKTGRELEKVPFAQEDRIGNVYCSTLKNIDADSVSWLFYEEDMPVPDDRGRAFPGRQAFGKAADVRDLRAAFPEEGFEWGVDRFPRIPYHQAIGYCLHVRGFTKHASSGVKHRGTFAGLAEKIPYLREIGVTTIELQPAYEFTELPYREEAVRESAHGMRTGEPRFGDGTNPPFEWNPAQRKLNYWGYKKGFYYAPKAAYAAGDPAGEFKALVRELHRNHMELVMQFYFPWGVQPGEITEILRFWVLEYHVDGFHLMGENLMADMLAADELLADTKIWYYCFDTGSNGNQAPAYPHLGEYNDAWYYDMRRFLKGDGGMLDSVLYHMRHIPDQAGAIHYISNYYGFTLADLVSYDRKHNEHNGEENRDGNDYNCSWNCGEEGAARRKRTRQLRLRQMKNAMCLLLFSQSTPLLFMGDEFGNSQKGNNNPYCQDNAITWLDWEQGKKNKEILDFWKKLVAFRREHPILHPAKELRLMDYLACGYPDLSYHGQNAWQPRTDGCFRHIGIMFCGKYAQREEKSDDTFLYLAMNMDWVGQELALPKLPKGMEWTKAFSTEETEDTKEEEKSGWLRKVGPRAISVYVGRYCSG